ncbi:MAG: hypothetical protein SGILL_005138 [Bacillariaceae sp.]
MDGILERIVNQQEKHTMDLLEQKAQQRMQDDWAMERELWRNELVGNRNLNDDASSFSSEIGGRGGGDFYDNRNYNASGGLLMGGSNGNGNYRVASPEEQQLFEKVAKEHGKIVVQNIKNDDGATTTFLGTMEQFENIAVSRGNNTPQDKMYRNAWQLLEKMLPNLKAGPIHAALGSLDYLCCQFQRILSDQVRSAAAAAVSGSAEYPTSALATGVAAFCKLTLGNGTSVWDVLYYCLRCGDAQAAIAVVNSAPAGTENFAQEQAVLQKVLLQFSQRQGGDGCMFGAGVVPIVEPQEQYSLRDFYEKAMRFDPNNKSRLKVLALLSGNEVDTSAFSDVEEWLVFRLWLGVQDRDEQVSKLTLVGTDIRRLGHSHFDTDANGPWAYCLPLMVSQQCQTALSFLAEAGGEMGLLEATHLGLAFLSANVKVTDLGKTLPAGHGHRDLSSTLLVQYAKLLERMPSFGLRQSLQYLLNIPSEMDRKNEIAEMIYRNPDRMGEVTGMLDAGLNRIDCELEKYISPHEASSILELAGKKFVRDAAHQQKAREGATLFLLSGSYAKLLALFNRLISPPHAFDGDKIVWANETQKFYSDYLKSHSIVKEVLGREKKLGLIETTNTLLGLRQFFQLYQSGDSKGAFDAVSTLGLFPFSQEEIDEKTSKFKDLDPHVKSAMPDALVTTVRCLYESYRDIKSKHRAITIEVEDQLKRIKSISRFLFLFSGTAGMPQSCKQDINDMRANMV